MICPQLSITIPVLDMYADDAELHCRHSDLHVVERCLQSDLNFVATWLHSSHLAMYVSMLINLIVYQRVADKVLSQMMVTC